MEYANWTETLIENPLENYLFPFETKRTQFTVIFCIVMTISKGSKGNKIVDWRFTNPNPFLSRPTSTMQAV